MTVRVITSGTGMLAQGRVEVIADPTGRFGPAEQRAIADIIRTAGEPVLLTLERLEAEAHTALTCTDSPLPGQWIVEPDGSYRSLEGDTPWPSKPRGGVSYCRHPVQSETYRRRIGEKQARWEERLVRRLERVFQLRAALGAHPPEHRKAVENAVWIALRLGAEAARDGLVAEWEDAALKGVDAVASQQVATATAKALRERTRNDRDAAIINAWERASDNQRRAFKAWAADPIRECFGGSEGAAREHLRGLRKRRPELRFQRPPNSGRRALSGVGSN